MPVVKTTIDIVKGNKIFHPKCINWSYRYLGKLARIRINKKQITETLKKKKNVEVTKKKPKLKLSNPPKKRMVNKADIKSILLYSPKKKKAKTTEEYSTLNPATSSASASGKSNGARLVSASIIIMKIKTSGSSGIINQPLLFWVKTISVKLADPVKTSIGIKENIKEIS